MWQLRKTVRFVRETMCNQDMRYVRKTMRKTVRNSMCDGV